MLPTQEDLDNKIDELFKEQIGCERIDNNERYVIKLITKWYATEAIKLLERVVNTTSMQNIADLEDDITKFLDEYYNQENEE
jgi:hypothetical protein